MLPIWNALRENKEFSKSKTKSYFILQEIPDLFSYHKYLNMQLWIRRCLIICVCKILVQNFIIKDILKKKNVVHWISVRTIEQWRLVVMNNLWKFHCRVADNKTYRTVRTSYVNCMHKTEFLWFSCWQCLSSCYYVTETRSPNEANHLKRVRIKSQQSETSSNKQKYKWIASLWNISYCIKNVTFINWGYLYSSIVCARSIGTFKIKWHAESR